MLKGRNLLGLLISLLFLFLAIRNVEWSTVLSDLKNIDILYFVITVGLLFVSLFFRTLLWKNLLRYKKNVSARHAFEAITIGYMGNNILPFRMGELVRAYAMSKKEGVSKSMSLASIVLERILDVFSLLIFFAALFFSIRMADWLVWSGIIVLGFLILMVVLIYFAASEAWNFSSLLTRLLRYFPSSISQQAERVAQSFIQGLALIKNRAQVIEVVFLSLMAWSVWAVGVYYCLKAFHLELPYTAPLLLMVVINMGIMIPSSPGFIGVFQYLCVVSLSFFSVSKETALGFSVLLHAIQYVPMTLLGWIFLTRMHLSLSRSLQAELEK